MCRWYLKGDNCLDYFVPGYLFLPLFDRYLRAGNTILSHVKAVFINESLGVDLVHMGKRQVHYIILNDRPFEMAFK